MPKNGVYLVSSRPTDDDQKTFDNKGFTEENVTYSPEKGVDVPVHDTKSFPLRPYRGMGKEDLLHFSSQPFWSRLRMVCIAVVVLGWLALIITVVALVLVYPKCRDPSTRSWWQTEPMYRVYVPSFKDSNDDGIGDLKGIESRLDYIKSLGFGVVSLSPFYQTVDTGMSSVAGFGAGNDMAVTNHKQVGEVYGTLDDFDSLIAEAHTKGIHVVVDFIPNLTSDEHPWFVLSKVNTTNEKRNYYVWQTGAEEPNNWRSVYGGPAWLKPMAGSRDEYYLHQFQPDTPDLNLRSAQVQDELKDILTFWLDHGVSGFNIRDAPYLYEDYDLRDEPIIQGQTDYDGLDHVYTTNQPEVYSIIDRWRSIIRAHNKTTTDKLLMVNGNGHLDVRALYGECDRTGVQMPLNTRLEDLPRSCDASCVGGYVDGWMDMVPSGQWLNWLSGDDNTPRLSERFSDGFINAFTIMTMLLPGTPVYYYGDELGINSTTPDTSEVWSRNRSMRSIMLWDNSTDAGFCNTTCITVWTTRIRESAAGNVQTGTPLSTMITKLAELRRESSFQIGSYVAAVRDSAIFSFVREFDGESGYLVAINFGPTEETRDFTGSHRTIQKEAVVSFAHGGSYTEEDDVDTSSLAIPAYGGVVVSWEYVAEEL